MTIVFLCKIDSISVTLIFERSFKSIFLKLYTQVVWVSTFSDGELELSVRSLPARII